MNTEIKQQNTYRIVTSSGKETEFYITASNLKEASKIAKEKYSKVLGYGKLVRCYNGGVRG